MTLRLSWARRRRATPSGAALGTLLALLTLFGVSLAAPAASNAGTMAVVQCGDVFGQNGPLRAGIFPYRDGTLGFQPGGNASQGGRLDPCTGADLGYGTGMAATLTGAWDQATGNRVTWTWRAAPDTLAIGYAMEFRWRGRPFDGNTGTHAEIYVTHQGLSDPNYDWRQLRPDVADQWSDSTVISPSIPEGTNAIEMGAVCGGVSLGRTCPWGGTMIAQIVAHGFQVRIVDNANPQVANVSGDLVDQRYWPRKPGVSASITDKGTGVATIGVQERQSDGNWIDRVAKVVDTNSGKCVPITNAGATVLGEKTIYGYAQPCRTDASGDIDVDTTTLPEGDRMYRVVVRDATGNQSVLVGQQSRVIDRTAPTVSFDGTPDVCVAGNRVPVQADASDKVSGLQSVQTLVTKADGSKLPVAADGTIECPAVGDGPLAVTTTAVDRSGNETSVTRSKPVEVKAPPVVTPDPPVVTTPGTATPNDGAVGGGKADTNSDATKLVATPITPAPTPAPAPDTRGAAAAKLLACEKTGVVLTEAYPSGKKDILRGVAGAKYVGQTVTITYGSEQKVVSRLPVGLDGSFTATVKAPQGKSGRGNAARYQASVGAERSSTIKRMRRMYATQVYRTANGGAVYVAGRLSKPFKSGTTVTIQTRAAGCGASAWRSVKKTKVDRRGNFGASFPVASSDQAVVVRTVTKVQRTAKSRRGIRTQTLPSQVQMR